MIDKSTKSSRKMKLKMTIKSENLFSETMTAKFVACDTKLHLHVEVCL